MIKIKSDASCYRGIDWKGIWRHFLGWWKSSKSWLQYLLHKFMYFSKYTKLLRMIDQYDKPSPARFSPGKNIHLNFYIVSITSAHTWIYLSFGGYIKQWVSVRYYLSRGIFFCSFLFSVNLMENQWTWFEACSAIFSSPSVRWYHLACFI